MQCCVVGRANEGQIRRCARWCRTAFGATLGLRRWMRYAEMTRHKIAIGILQPLGMRVCDCDSAQMHDFHCSVSLQRDLAGHLPLLPSATVASAQPVPHHALNAVSKTSNFLQIPYS